MMIIVVVENIVITFIIIIVDIIIHCRPVGRASPPSNKSPLRNSMTRLSKIIFRHICSIITVKIHIQMSSNTTSDAALPPVPQYASPEAVIPRSQSEIEEMMIFQSQAPDVRELY